MHMDHQSSSMMFSCFQLEPVPYYMQLFSIWISDLCFAGLTNFLHDSMYGVPAAITIFPVWARCKGDPGLNRSSVMLDSAGTCVPDLDAGPDWASRSVI